jgi:hypothetical protein
MIPQYRNVEIIGSKQAHQCQSSLSLNNHITIVTQTSVLLMQLQYQLDSDLNPDLCIARDCFMILILNSFQFNAVSRRIQRHNWPYDQGVTTHICGHHSTSLVTGNSVTLLTTTGIFASKLLSSTHRHFASNTFLLYEVFNSQTSCTNTSTFNKTNSLFIIVFRCGREFIFLSVPFHLRPPSRSTFLTFYVPNPPDSLGYDCTLPTKHTHTHTRKYVKITSFSPFCLTQPTYRLNTLKITAKFENFNSTNY